MTDQTHIISDNIADIVRGNAAKLVLTLETGTPGRIVSYHLADIPFADREIALIEGDLGELSVDLAMALLHTLRSYWEPGFQLTKLQQFIALRDQGATS